MKHFLALFSFFITGNLYAQKIDKEDLYRTWYLDKYSDATEYYQPPKKETDDFITFHKNMTFNAKTEGELSSGTWMLNTNGNYLELKYERNDSEKLYIYFLSTRSLVLMYDTDEYRIWEVHYVSGK
ncbi:hypothetical protein FNH22_28445 [Fulvivirga sp. M361]|uniref:lipocalin family protein n=1 Tax=Fulvivirga sp. M361 TaxID=2594266 RepID=UPI00117A3952|nr:lipocalin family protein [Fulvivirga sp. M361]TRX48695.1 hypothetical protein FNH22_28445 [Fulvivirga sp. M361]